MKYLDVPSRKTHARSAVSDKDSPGFAELHKTISLVDRLLDVECRVQDLERQNSKLRRDSLFNDTPGSHSGSFFDVPRATHEWILATNVKALPEGLGLYDVRCDDAVVMEGRAGRAFMDQFNLGTETPDFDAAVDAINAIDGGLVCIKADEGIADVSIVIPIYGQLAYTLNCIDSLRRHRSRYTAQIIIIDDAGPDDSHVHLPKVRHIEFRRQPKNGGFISSCNAGGTLATGRFMVMLNNDTRVVAGWLDHLIGSFEVFPHAGLVGSKMLYADGTLQEAGGIIWRDASAWNYGRNDDPNRPQYCYSRQVDYISGCSICLPTLLWNEIHGFDPHYRPAYCEDADIAFRVKAGGREVWYQPLSRIIHYEGKTSGTDTASGAKAYQIVNTKKLYLRWRTVLAAHRRNAEAPYLERERGVQQRFLIVDATTPTPDQDAGSVQTFMALQACQQLGYKPHFVPEDNWLFQPKYTPAMQRFGVDCAYAPYELGFDNYMRRYGWQFDVVMVYRAGIMEKTLPIIRTYAPQAAVIFHVADLHYLRMQRTAELSEDNEIAAAAAIMKEREMALIAAADCTVTHSTTERDILAVEAPGRPVVVWPLMFEYEGTKRKFRERRDLCFLGGYRHQPNVDAVTYFVREIFPRILAEEPDLRFLIAGAHPPAEVLALASDRVIVKGLVEDLRDLFDPCRVFVCPLRVGAGAKGKVVSALSYGIPIVSTSVGVEGAGLTDSENVLVADQPEDFAATTLRLYRDPELWNRISKAGQRLVDETLSVKTGKEILAHAVEIAFTEKLGLSGASGSSL